MFFKYRKYRKVACKLTNSKHARLLLQHAKFRIDQCGIFIQFLFFFRLRVNFVPCAATAEPEPTQPSLGLSDVAGDLAAGRGVAAARPSRADVLGADWAMLLVSFSYWFYRCSVWSLSV